MTHPSNKGQSKLKSQQMKYLSQSKKLHKLSNQELKSRLIGSQNKLSPITKKHQVIVVSKRQKRRLKVRKLNKSGKSLTKSKPLKINSS